ncbi:MAG TPA: hypothetical protein VGN88_03395 [Phycisphaerae bacterium]|jgi:predicted RNA-binding Zn-ribbon protein involved in translation (DUF1610 family)
MDSVQFMREKDEFTLVVRPAGWGGQMVFLLIGVLVICITAQVSSSMLHGNFKINDRPAEPYEVIYTIPAWAIGIGCLAAALQNAYRKTVISADARYMAIATSGPLRNTAQQFPRQSLVAANVGYSQTRVNGRQLKRLQLYFAEQTVPYCLLTGRTDEELARIAELLTENLHSDVKPYSKDEFMQVRHSPIYSTMFYTMCGIGVVIGLCDFGLKPFIGVPACAAIFFGTVLAIIVIFSRIARNCKCPQCDATIKRDNLSAEGNYQYTCPACRIVWQSDIRMGGGRRSS